MRYIFLLTALVASLSCTGVPQGSGDFGDAALFRFSSEGKAGFMDAAGVVRIAPEWDDADGFSGGLSAVRRDGLWGYIDAAGALAIECRFLSAGRFCEGFAAASPDGKLWGYINTSGDFIAKPAWDKAFDFSDGRGQVILGGLVGYVGTNGSLAIPLEYHSAGGFSEGLAEVKDDRGWLYIGTDGREMFRPDADETYAFSEGFAEFRKGDSWGYLDAKGRVAVAPRFSEAFAFSSGLGRVRQGSLFGYVDKSGAIVIPAGYKLAGNFRGGLAPVKNADGFWGYIDITGRQVIPFSFAEAGEFSGGLAYVERGQAFGYINAQGVFVWKNTEARTKFADETVFPVRTAPEGRRGDSFRYAFFAASDASSFLGEADDFTRSLTDFDRQSRLSSDRTVSDKKFREFAASQALDFSQPEKDRVSGLLVRFNEAFHWAFEWPDPVRFAKTTGKEELDSPYTRRGAIVLPQSLFKLGDEELYGFLAHELCHVLLLYNDFLRDGFYGAIGYKKIYPIKLQSFFQARKLTNPDALYYDYAYPESVDGVEYLFLPLLVHLKEYDPVAGKEFFDYMIPAYTAVEPVDGRSQGIWRNDAFVLLPQRSLKTYLDMIGRNTEYTIHPEEVLAENFSLLLGGKSKVDKPQLLESLERTLDEANQRRKTDDE